MLALQFRSADRPFSWTPAGRGWRSGDSFIHPFEHPSLESFSLTAGGRSLFVVRERIAGAHPLTRGDDFDRALDDARSWPLEFLIIATDNASAEATMYTGSWGVAPLLLIARDGTLHGHWDPSELYRYVDAREPLEPDLAAELLVRGGNSYSWRTVIRSLLMLTERARARWADGSLRIDYPRAVALPAARELKPDADVLGAFDEILTAAMRRWLAPGDPVPAAELSGGLDSAIVAATAAKVTGSAVRTFGLQMPPPSGASQRERRDELIGLFGFQDTLLDAESLRPFSNRRRIDEGLVVPWHEFYSDAFDEIYRLAHRSGARVVLSGLGGDELLFVPREGEAEPAPPLPPYLTPFARDALGGAGRDAAPAGLISTSAFDSAAGTGALAMRRGLWPINPLCTPEVVRFCSSLPVKWRIDRALERRFVQALGCSDAIAHPKMTESFGELMHDTLTRHARPLLEGLFAESRLAALNLVDGDALRSSYREHCERGTDESDMWFLMPAIAELTLRAIEISG